MPPKRKKTNEKEGEQTLKSSKIELEVSNEETTISLANPEKTLKSNSEENELLNPERNNDGGNNNNNNNTNIDYNKSDKEENKLANPEENLKESVKTSIRRKDKKTQRNKTKREGKTHSLEEEENDEDSYSSSYDSDTNSLQTELKTTQDFFKMNYQDILNYWTLHPPQTNSTFPNPPQGYFSGSSTGKGIWKQKEGGNQYKQCDGYLLAVLEYNFKRGVRYFTWNDENDILWEISLDHRSIRQKKNHEKKYIILRE